jgi:hypothetical protein
MLLIDCGTKETPSPAATKPTTVGMAEHSYAT